MNVKLELMNIAQKSVLVQLMELYNYEFTEFDDKDINEHGYYGYSHIDDYWNEQGRFPYLISVDGKIAGFALICNYCACRKEPQSRSFGEFFIMLKYRRRGIGEKVALELIEKHRGDWEIMFLNDNKRAELFWNNILDTMLENKQIEEYSVCSNKDGDMSGFLFSNLSSQ